VGRSRSGRIKRPDRFEQEQTAFYERVRQAYLRRAQEHPGRIHMLDAGEEIDRVQYKLGVLIKRLCNLEK
jgi:dTMP kinase